MRMSELSERTAVPVPTLKFYLRQGLLPPGEAVSRTRAEYDDSHVGRIRLIRALTEVGGLDLGTVARVLATIADPGLARTGVLGAAQLSLYGTPELVVGCQPDGAGSQSEGGPSRAQAFVAARGWQIHPDSPALADLERAWAACDDVELGLDDARLNDYANAVETIAAHDLSAVPDEPEAAVRQVVLGTVLVEPVLAALRRLAHQHLSATRARSTP